MTAAALMNIDSCPMEGFDLDGVTELLEHEGIIDSNQFTFYGSFWLQKRESYKT